MSEAVADIEMGLPIVAEDEAAIDRSWRLRALLFVLVFSPAMVMGIAVAHNAVNVPMWDDWERGELWGHYFDGTLDWRYLDSPHTEHRMLVGRLATLAGGLWFGGDLRFEIWLTFGFVCATALLCFYLLRHTLRGSPALWPAALLTNLLLFCPQQYPDFLWASMDSFMLPFLCLVAMLAAWVSRLPVWAKTSIGVLAALVASHSFSQGLVLWPVALCLPLLSPGAGPPKRRALAAAGVAGIMVVVLLYHFGGSFVNSSHITHAYGTATGSRAASFDSLDRAVADPGAWRRDYLSALGNPLARLFGTDPRETARGVGRVLLALFLAALGFMYWRRRDGVTWSRLLPWAAGGTFALGVACLLATGRATTPSRAVMPRYIPMTLFLTVALVALGAYVFAWWARRAGDDARAARRRSAYGWGAAAALAVLLVNLWIYGLHKMAAWKGSRLQARAALVYIDHFDPVEIGRLDSSLAFVRRQASVLNSHGLLDPPLAKRWGFACFSPTGEVLGKKRARLRVHDRGAGTVDVDGFATLPSGRIADGVLITVRGGDGGTKEWRVLGFAEMRSIHTINNLFLDTHFGQGPNLVNRDQHARFRGRATAADLPPEGAELLCWALDAERLVAHPIGKSVPLGEDP